MLRRLTLLALLVGTADSKPAHAGPSCTPCSVAAALAGLSDSDVHSPDSALFDGALGPKAVAAAGCGGCAPAFPLHTASQLAAARPGAHVHWCGTHLTTPLDEHALTCSSGSIWQETAC